MNDELYTTSVKAMEWDETLSMSIAQEIFPMTTLAFYQLIKPARVFLLDHVGEDLQSDLESLIASTPKPTTISTSFPKRVPASIMEDLGFEYSPGQTIRLMLLDDNDSVSPVPAGVIIQKIASLDDKEMWEERILVEAELFQYPPTGYIDRLRVGLATMFENDTHFLAFDNIKVIGYMTMRYTRGIAYLQGAGVLEPYRRQGITRHLLDLAKQDAKSKNFISMVTTGWNDAAEATWASLGFTTVLGTLETWTLKLT
ncbi:hypothetical protein THRCLA_05634 [Thraustotheca clavata]|uniref:N-acetyltransferase domain-containing protein n=1 Tax=Thraustotheca clavata TaxID=74557 RepID=A0A1V9ZV95_9STRA|nr:hypothetical protein THRCLA_05634 [Thraustotheca clavata]